MEEDAAAAKSQPEREQLERQYFPPWHGEGAGSGRQERGREEEKRHNLLSDPLSPSGLHGMKHEAESNSADGVTIRQGQSWGALIDGEAKKQSHPHLRVQCHVTFIQSASASAPSM